MITRQQPLLRGQTYHDRLYGKPPGVDALVALWSNALTEKLLGFVWDAYDKLYTTAWSKLDWTQRNDDLERSLSEELELAIRAVMEGHKDGYISIDIQHGPFEREAREDPPAQPPQYDLAFKWRSDPRIMWPLEAKVLKSDKNTGENLDSYIENGLQRFLTSYYAPFSNGGAMLGYLKSGIAETVIGNIAMRSGYALTPHPRFPDRCHRISDHQRTILPGKDYPVAFRCHHLILPLKKHPQ